MDEHTPNRWRKRPVEVTAQRMSAPFEVKTMEGTMRGKAGDWLITGVQGEQYPCDDAIFRATYEPPETEPTPDLPRMRREDAERVLADATRVFSATRAIASTESLAPSPPSRSAGARAMEILEACTDFCLEGRPGSWQVKVDGWNGDGLTLAEAILAADHAKREANADDGDKA